MKQKTKNNQNQLTRMDFEEVLGKRLEAHTKTIIETVDKKMDGRLKEYNKKMDGRFEEHSTSILEAVDYKFNKVDRKLNKVEKKLDRVYNLVDRSVKKENRFRRRV